jgi:type III secretory pathway component EscR
MREQRFPRYVICAVLSLASPIIAFLATRTYQSVANSAFWSSLTPEDSAAAVFGVFAEIGELIFFTMIGCFVGIIFAVISLRVQRRILGLGLVGVVFNGLPLLLFMFYLIKGWTVGF